VVCAILKATGNAAARVGEPDGPGMDVNLHHNTSTGTNNRIEFSDECGLLRLPRGFVVTVLFEDIADLSILDAVRMATCYTLHVPDL
jgi:hypothetical protein